MSSEKEKSNVFDATSCDMRRETAGVHCLSQIQRLTTKASSTLHTREEEAVASSPTHNKTSTICVAKPDSINPVVTPLDLKAELRKGRLELSDSRSIPLVSSVSVRR